MQNKNIKHIIMLILSFVFSVSVSAQFGGNRYALIIGNADYKNITPPLPNTINDAADIAAALQKLGYQVDMRKNSNINDFDASVERFINNLARNPQNEGFFWYAGHGVQIDGENYLLPIDIQTETKSQIERGSYSLNTLLKGFERSQNKVNVVILDACRNNPLQSATRGITLGLAAVGAVPRDLIIMYSTAAGSTADDGGKNKRNSPFTEAFLKNINNNEPVAALLSDVTKDTLSLTANRQRPFQTGSIIDKNYSLAGILAPSPILQVAPIPITQNNTSYKIGERGPAGGWIFYDKGVFSNGWRYLEAAPAETELNAEWGAYKKNISGISTNIGSGKRNTKTIVEYLQNIGESGKAAQLCDSLVLDGFDDWFLPSKDELNLMYTILKQKGHGEFSDTWYWSSSQSGISGSWLQNFNDGKQLNGHRGNSNTDLVRAVRAF
jgi:hypothetical protein